MRLENAYPEQLEEAKRKNIPIFIPVGTIEYHSAHLPLGTDTQVAFHTLERLEKTREIIIAPPVWYGPSSYAVRGPEGNSVDMDGTVLNATMYNIYMSLLKSGFRRIYTVIAHQTEDFNPTETACLDASRRVIFKFLEETRGIGWWGDRKMQSFYGTLDSEDNPWNYIRVCPIYPPRDMKGDHAGKYETSMLWALRPDLVREDKIGMSDDWFTETAKDASLALGEEMIGQIIAYWESIV
ncbi:MAG: creatininase family protein [Ruminococcaceae bacterium]|nr:creatininase family protein [Oscillospiraceae bacterium]